MSLADTFTHYGKQFQVFQVFIQHSVPHFWGGGKRERERENT